MAICACTISKNKIKCGCEYTMFCMCPTIKNKYASKICTCFLYFTPMGLGATLGWSHVIEKNWWWWHAQFMFDYPITDAKLVLCFSWEQSNCDLALVRLKFVVVPIQYGRRFDMTWSDSWIVCPLLYRLRKWKACSYYTSRWRKKKTKKSVLRVCRDLIAHFHLRILI